MPQHLDSDFTSYLQSPFDKGKVSKSYLEFRNNSALLILWPSNAIAVVIGVFFALKIDPILHPDFLELRYARIVSCGIFTIILLLSFLPRFKKHGLMLLFITYLVMLIFFSFICGHLMSDQNYFSGLQITLVLSMFVPVSLATISVSYLISMIVLYISFSIYHPYSLSVQEYYIMYNLAIAYLIGGIGFFVLDRYRFTLFMNQLQLEELATVDALTKVSNRRYFLHILEREHEQNKRYKKPLSLLMMDLDHFKKVNDTYGHAAGDYVLMEFARICSSMIRKADLMGRLGGEEFVIMLPNTDIENTRILAERIRIAVEQTIFEHQSSCFHMTVSIGLASLLPTEEIMNPQQLLAKADEYLYIAKEKGRNRVCWKKNEGASLTNPST